MVNNIHEPEKLKANLVKYEAYMDLKIKIQKEPNTSIVGKDEDVGYCLLYDFMTGLRPSFAANSARIQQMVQDSC